MSDTPRKPDPVPGRPSASLRLVVSLEAILYAALTAAALALRLLRLDWLPLDAQEAAAVLPAWQAAGAEAVATVPPQPLLFHLERLLLWVLGGGSDVTARLVAATAGTVAVALVWRLRGILGRPAALSLALLLALSPVWVFASRQATGGSLSAATIILLIGALAGGSRWDRDLVPVAAALLVAAGGLAYVFLGAAACYLAVSAVRGELRDHLTVLAGMWPEPSDRRRAAVIFAATIVLAATGLLSRPDGFAALVQAPVSWASALVASPMGFWNWVALPLLVYAPVIVVFGIVGLLVVPRASSRMAIFLASWCGLGLVVTVVARAPAAVPELALPLTFAASLGLAALAALVAEGFRWQEEGVMIGILLSVLGFALVQAALHGNDGSDGSARLVAGALVLSFALVLVYAVLWGPRLALRVAGVTAVIVLPVLAWANGASLNYEGGRIVRELLHPSYATSDAAGLARNLALASWAETRDPNELGTYVAPSLQPQLAWRLRERSALEWTAPSDETSAGAVILPSSTEKPTLGQGEFRGMPYAISGRWQPQLGTPRNFLRWYLQRRAPADTSRAGDIAYDQVDLYLKTDS